MTSAFTNEANRVKDNESEKNIIQILKVMMNNGQNIDENTIDQVKKQISQNLGISTSDDKPQHQTFSINNMISNQTTKEKTFQKSEPVQSNSLLGQNMSLSSYLQSILQKGPENLDMQIQANNHMMQLQNGNSIL